MVIKPRNEENISTKNCSHHGNSGNSFKSVKSYILGDLDISNDEDQEDEDSNSFEISSNSSGKMPLNPESLKQLEEDQPYLCNEAFISKQSPFSFKNPIFYSCPNNKQGGYRLQPLKNTEYNCKK